MKGRHRVNRIELEDYCNNAGLTALQCDILRLKYFEKDDMSIVAICLQLNISTSKYCKEAKELWCSIARYKKSCDNAVNI